MQRICEVLRRGSGTVGFIELRVWIPQEAWMPVSCVCCLLSGRDLCDGPIHHPNESYRVCHLVWSDATVTLYTYSEYVGEVRLRKKGKKCKSLPAPLDFVKYRAILSLRFICLCRLSSVVIHSGFLHCSDLCLSVYRRHACGSQRGIKLARSPERMLPPSEVTRSIIPLHSFSTPPELWTGLLALRRY
jgi:hypothetical protein